MKNWCLLLAVLLLTISCNQKDPKREKASLETKIENQVEIVPVNDKVKVYDYNELEREFFLPTTNKTYVINFWATWCKPCIKELPAFEKLNANYKEANVEVVLVSLDFPEKIENGVIPFMEKNNLQSKVVLLDDPDANTWIPKVSPEWSGAIPATVIIRDGKRHFFERTFTYETLEKEIKTVL